MATAATTTKWSHSYNTAPPDGISDGITIYYRQQVLNSNGEQKITAFKREFFLYIHGIQKGLDGGCYRVR